MNKIDILKKYVGKMADLSFQYSSAYISIDPAQTQKDHKYKIISADNETLILEDGWRKATHYVDMNFVAIVRVG